MWVTPVHFLYSWQHPRHRHQHAHVDRISAIPGSTHARLQHAHVDRASAPPPLPAAPTPQNPACTRGPRLAPPPIPAAPAPPSPLQLQPITGFVVPLGSSLHTRVHGRVVPACGMGGAAQPVWVSAPSLFVIEPIQQLAAAAGPLLAQSHSSGEES